MKLHMTLLGILVGLSLVQPAQADNVYRWVDKDGKVHFGDRPPSEAAEELRVTDKSAPISPSSHYDGEDEDADINEATPDTRLTADSGAKRSPATFSAKQLLGRWQDDMLNDAFDTYAADGSYTRDANLFGSKLTLKGSWKLVGNELQVQIKTKSMTLPNGQSKTEADVRLNKSQLISISAAEMTLLRNTKGGELEFTYKKVGV
ncbi:DUF4124 domain-containing protein [Shewanella sp. FJAT-52076]|uniref:DUF4124 domain-containing protein n=1 Tax=Shewanella sp. FJAT-52076 TaxID=2864202 RepID=UPI001C65B205|nr:DUF4124 domain-containing protein [Shewanella sp. FJAT-52076]QYJ76068.1 DUF4124 domain-containing protein [Shewanella sp. FJAT-52076]